MYLCIFIAQTFKGYNGCAYGEDPNWSLLWGNTPYGSIAMQRCPNGPGMLVLIDEHQWWSLTLQQVLLPDFVITLVGTAPTFTLANHSVLESFKPRSASYWNHYSFWMVPSFNCRQCLDSLILQICLCLSYCNKQQTSLQASCNWPPSQQTQNPAPFYPWTSTSLTML